jgi:hypothetical protein
MNINSITKSFRQPSNLFLSSGRIFSLIVFIAFLYGCKPNPVISDEEKIRDMLQRNKVKTITEFVTQVRMGIDDQEVMTKESHFNRYGLSEKIISYTADTTIESTVTFTYDNDHKLLVKNGVNSDGTSFNETTSYDKNGNRLEVVHHLPGGKIKFGNITLYDANGKMTEVDWSGPLGATVKVVYVYEGENKTEEKEYSHKGELTYTWKYKYEGDDLIEAVQYLPDNKVTQKFTQVFGKDDQIVKKSYFSGEELSKSSVYEYDPNGLLASRTDYSANGEIVAKYRYQYEYY